MQTRIADLEGDMLKLKRENSALKQDNEAARAELTRARETLHAHNLPLFPSPAGPQGEPRPSLDVVETPSVTVHSIR